MLAQRAEPARAAEEPAQAEGVSARPAARGGLAAWLPLGLALLLMPALAYAMTAFVLVPKMQKTLAAAGLTPAQNGSGPAGSAAAAAPGAAPGAPHQNVALNKLLVNVAGTMGSRYLLTSLTITGTAADLPTKIADNEPQLRDLACGLLSTKTIVDLEKPGARNIIRGELLAGFNNILGNGEVQEIYFTEFSIQ